MIFRYNKIIISTIFENNMNIHEIEEMKKYIESMTKFHQIEILKILSKNLCKINENKSGVFVNLTFLPQNVLLEIKEYINYIKDQDNCLNTLETQKNEFKNTFFTNEKIDKDIKEDATIAYNIIR